MRIKNLVLVTILLIVFLCFGQTLPAKATTIAELQAQILALQAQLQALQGQQTTEPSWCYTFTTNMGYGATGPNFNALITVLDKEGIMDFSDSNRPSEYNEDIGGGVVELQAKYGIRQTGYFGSMTRAKINAIYGCGIVARPTATISTSSQTTSLNPYIIGTAIGTSKVGVVLSSQSGDRVYGSGLVSVISGNWSVTVMPALSLGNYTIYVYDANNRQLTSKPLSVVSSTQPSITVTSPNGGETWAQDSSQRITWTTANIPASNGMTVRLRDIAGAEHYLWGISDTVLNSGVFYGIIPPTIAAGQYKAEVKTSIGSQSYIDASNNFFTITAPTTQSTNGSCGSARGVSSGTMPSSNLCSLGTPSIVSGSTTSGSWYWTCAGSNNGTTANCSASACTPTRQANNYSDYYFGDSDKNGYYGNCDPTYGVGSCYGNGVRDKLTIVKEALDKQTSYKLENIQSIKVISCVPFNGPGGSYVTGCPAGTTFTYCVKNQNDGVANSVLLGVVSSDQISTQPTINSVSPASGPAGTVVIIYGSNFSTTVQNQVTFNDPTHDDPVTATTSSDGTRITFTVPSSTFSGITPGTYNISVENTAGQHSNFVAFTVTSAPQSTITVLAPNGEQYWQVGSTNNIAWSFVGLPTNTAVDIFLQYLTVGRTETPDVIARNVSGMNYTWVVPNVPAGNYKISIQLHNQTSNVLAGLSQTFNITQPIITVISPNGGWEPVNVSNPVIVSIKTTTASPIKNYINLIDTDTNSSYSLDSLLGSSGIVFTSSQISQPNQTITFSNITASYNLNTSHRYKIEACTNGICDRSDNYFNIVTTAQPASTSSTNSNLAGVSSAWEALLRALINR